MRYEAKGCGELYMIYIINKNLSFIFSPSFIFIFVCVCNLNFYWELEKVAACDGPGMSKNICSLEKRLHLVQRIRCIIVSFILKRLKM